MGKAAAVRYIDNILLLKLHNITLALFGKHSLSTDSCWQLRQLPCERHLVIRRCHAGLKLLTPS